MTSLILRTATRFMLPVLLLFSVFLLLRGHNEPGGGFSGGLVAGCAFALFALAFGVAPARQMLKTEPRVLIGAGLMTALASGCLPLLRGEPFLTHKSFWTELPVRGLGVLELSTPLAFDTGVYLTVLGVTLLIVLTLAEE